MALALSVILSLAIQLRISAQTVRGTGVLADDRAYAAIPMASTTRSDDELVLPERYSLKGYAPFAGDQGATRTCVGWSASYAARTIAEARARGWSDRALITDRAFSPSFVYNLLQISSFGSTDDGCSRGAYSFHALALLKSTGTIALADFPFDCSLRPTSEDSIKAAANRILDFIRLFDVHDRSKTKSVKRSVASGNPVVIVMPVSTSFRNLGMTGVWRPTREDTEDNELHSMTVVGFDDDVHGGAFEVMNSWGRAWGNDGFAWIPYEVFDSIVRYGLAIHVASTSPDGVEVARATVSILDDDWTSLPLEQHGSLVRVGRDLPSGSLLALRTSLQASGYVYGLGSDRTRLIKVNIPDVELGESAYRNSGSTDEYWMRLDDTVGTDQYAVLISQKPIDIDAVRDSLMLLPGELSDQLERYFRDRPKVRGLSGSSVDIGGYRTDRGLDYVVFAVEHTERKPSIDKDPPQVTILSPKADTLDGTVDFRLLLSDIRQMRIIGTIVDDSGLGDVVPSVGSIRMDEDRKRFVWTVATEALEGRVALLSVSDEEGNSLEVSFTGVRSLLPDWEPQVRIVTPRVDRQPLNTDLALTGEVRVEGFVQDDGAVAEIYVNGQQAALESSGRFTMTVTLIDRDGRLNVQMVDRYSRVRTETFYIIDQVVWEGASSAPEQEYVLLDVFYGTDRKRTGHTAAARMYGGERGNLEVGVASVSIPATHRPGALEEPAWWKLEFRQDQAKHVVLTDVESLGVPAARQRLQAAVGNSQDRSAFVFVHGYNTNFEQAVKRTAQLAYDLYFDGVPIVYSWPSDARLTAYADDEKDAENAVSRFRTFLDEVVLRSGVSRVQLVAHSMGARVLVKAMLGMPESKGSTAFDSVVLAAADIDAEQFKDSYAAPLLARANQVTTYTSATDNALSMSSFINRATRIGDSSDGVTLVPGVQTVDVENTDLSYLGIGHGYYASIRSVLSDIANVFRGIAAEDRGYLLRQVTASGVYWILRPEL